MCVGMFNKGKYIRVRNKKEEIINYKTGLVDSVFNNNGYVWSGK